MTKQTTMIPDKNGLFATIMSKPYLLLVLAPLAWAGNVIAGKLAVGELDPMILSASRWILATLIATPFCLSHVRRDWNIIKPALPLLILLGVIGFSIFNALMYIAMNHTSGINASMEQALIPIIVMIGNFLVFKVRATPLHIIGVALTIIGVLYITTHGELASILSLDLNQGDAMIIGACILYAIYSLLLRYRPAIHWLSFLYVTTLSAAVSAVIIAAILGQSPVAIITTMAGASVQSWLIVLYTAVIASILAQLFYARGVSLIGPNRASLFINLIPIFGAVMSVLILGETMQPFHLIAAVFIICGIGLAEYAAFRKTK